MACNERRLLESDVDSAAHHLQMRLTQKDTSDLKFELAEVKRMAQDLVDAIGILRKHSDQHRCNN